MWHGPCERGLQPPLHAGHVAARAGFGQILRASMVRDGFNVT